MGTRKARYGNGIQDSCECGHARTSHKPETGECYRFPCPCSHYRDTDDPQCFHCGHLRSKHAVLHSLPVDPDVSELGESSWHGKCRGTNWDPKHVWKEKCRCVHFELEPPLDVVMRGVKILRLVRASV